MMTPRATIGILVHPLNFKGLVVRTVETFDWGKQVRAWWPKLSEARTNAPAKPHFENRLPALTPRMERTLPHAVDDDGL
jgi:hypothetical protein